MPTPLADASARGSVETEAIPLSEQPKLVGRHLNDDRRYQHVLSTYLSLRQLLALTAFLFPIVLIGAGWLFADVPLRASFSDYYQLNVARDFLVGGLFLVAGLLAAYRGYSPAENALLNTAAVMACLVALFPGCVGCSAVSLHGVSAVSFFVLIACVTLFCSRQTLEDPHALNYLKGRVRTYKNWYRICAAFMVGGPAVALVANWIGRFNEAILAAEWIGVWAYASFWVLKTKELRESKLLQIDH
jgi:hypothetical protein